MKKGFTLLFCLVFFATILSTPAYAYINRTEDEHYKEQQIDELFLELNNIALKKYMADNNLVPSSTFTDRDNYEGAILDIEESLEALGTHKIDPNNPEDMESFLEIVGGAPMIYSGSDDDPLESSVIPYYYGVYQTKNSVTIDNISYDYRVIRVVDEKGRGGLTSSCNVGLISGESSLLRDLLAYNFSFVLNKYLGTLPHSAFTEWSLGNISTVFDSYTGDEIVTVAKNATEMYNMQLMSITEMRYYFLYIPEYAEWNIIGSKANLSFTRNEAFVGNIKGKLVNETKEYPIVNSSTGDGVSARIICRDFLSSRRAQNYPIGSLTITSQLNNSKRKILVFEPKYFSTLNGL